MTSRLLSAEKKDVPYQVASLESSQQLGIFACGSYVLNKESGHRSGQITLCDASGEVLKQSSPELAGVLDMKWRHDSTLAVASADGSLTVYDTHLGDADTPITNVASDTSPEEGLYLSLDACSRNIVVSTQNGSILSYSVGDGNCRLSDKKTGAHCLFGENVPAWIVAKSRFSTDLICSGGDDMVIRLWDLRCLGAPTAAASKTHTAGVTSAMFSPSCEHLLAVGSYDEHISIWDIRNMRKEVGDIHAGGYNNKHCNFYARDM